MAALKAYYLPQVMAVLLVLSTLQLGVAALKGTTRTANAFRRRNLSTLQLGVAALKAAHPDAGPPALRAFHAAIGRGRIESTYGAAAIQRELKLSTLQLGVAALKDQVAQGVEQVIARFPRCNWAWPH